MALRRFQQTSKGLQPHLQLGQQQRPQVLLKGKQPAARQHPALRLIVSPYSLQLVLVGCAQMRHPPLQMAG